MSQKHIFIAAGMFVIGLVIGVLVANVPRGEIFDEDDIDGGIACTKDARICPDGSAVGRIGPDCEFAPCPGETFPEDFIEEDEYSRECFSDADCSKKETCLDPSPVIRTDEPAHLRCWPKGMPTPICLSSQTRIASPQGDVFAKDIKEGMMVWTVDSGGERIAVPVVLAGKTRAPKGHEMAHLVLADGKEIFVSPGHPLADGRHTGEISVGDMIEGIAVIKAERILYDEDFTYDILPAGESGVYFANGFLLKSTLQ